MLVEVEITDLKIDSGLVIPSKSILKNQENRDYIWVLSEKEDNIYSVSQVFEAITSYGEALINKSDQRGMLIIESGARGIIFKRGRIK